MTAEGAGLPYGAWLHGTHSLRVTGAILGFAANLSEEEVRALGRWTSTKAMKNYLRGTPVVKSSAASIPMANPLMQGVVRDLTSAHFRRALDMTPEPEQGPEKPAGPEGLLAVRHNLTGVLHRAGSMAGPPQTYWCGWKWAAAGCAGAFTTSDGTPCSRCCDVTK